MTVQEYEALKGYLGAPPVTVVPTHPLWSAPMWPEDPVWPTPSNWKYAHRTMSKLPKLQQMVCRRVANKLALFMLCENDFRDGRIGYIVRMLDAWIYPTKVSHSRMEALAKDCAAYPITTRLYIRRWWAKCRNVLAFWDVTTADIEWMTES